MRVSGWGAYVWFRRLSVAVVPVAGLVWPAGAQAATAIDGGDVGGQVWTAVGSPYVINGELRVPAGRELRIEAGTTVLFSNTTHVLLVEGTLHVTGTSAAPVTLQGEPSGAAVAWKGIVSAATGAPELRIAGANIQDARIGVSIGSGVAQIDRTTFENCSTGISLSANTRTYAFDSLVVRNNLVGVECAYCGTARFTNFVARGNTIRAAIVYGDGTLSFVNSTFDGNQHGADVWPQSTGRAVVEFVNTILSNNTVAVELDLRFGNGFLTAQHSTFWSNRSNLHYKHWPSGTDVITAGTEVPAGAGNVVADPRYVSATDLHLSAGSPCIDSGSATGAPDHDVDQAIRPVDGDGVPDFDGSTFDRGAYEFAATGGEVGGAGGGSAAAGDAGSNGGGAAGAGSDAESNGGGAAGGDEAGGSGSASGGANGASTGGGDANGGLAGSANANGGNSMAGASGGGDVAGGAGRSTGTGGAGGASSGTTPKHRGCSCALGAASAPRAGLPLFAVALGLLLRRARRKTQAGT